MDRNSIILLLAFAASSVLLLFENTPNFSLYIYSPLNPNINVTKFDKIAVSLPQESSLEIPLRKTANNLYTMSIQSVTQSKSYNLIVSTNSNNDYYFYNYMILCCSSPFSNKDTCVSNCRNVSSVSCSDGEDCTDQMITFDFEEKYSLGIKLDPLTKQDLTIGTTLFPNQTVDAVYSTDSIWKDTDGSIGVGYSKSQSSFYQFLKTNFVSEKVVFDIKKNGSSLVLGAKTNEYPLIWSERSYRISPWYLQNTKNGFDLDFLVYNLSVCDQPLLNNYSMAWTASINTMIEGIRLPSDLYYFITSWIQNSNVSTWDEKTQLPTLQFGLSRNGPNFYVPLISLWDSKLKKFHLTASETVRSYFYDGGLLSLSPKIEFGTRVLDLLTVGYDLKNFKTGLAQKEGIIISNTFCAPKTVCFGEQEYYPPSNQCLNPICPYFKSIDPYNHTCTLRIEFYIILVIIFGILIFYETVIYYLYQRTSANLEV
jgi:hypothetical protein